MFNRCNFEAMDGSTFHVDITRTQHSPIKKNNCVYVSLLLAGVTISYSIRSMMMTSLMHYERLGRKNKREVKEGSASKVLIKYVHRVSVAHVGCIRHTRGGMLQSFEPLLPNRIKCPEGQLSP